MYGGDLSGGAVGGSSWKAPEDPALIVGSKEEVSFYLNIKKLFFVTNIQTSTEKSRIFHLQNIFWLDFFQVAKNLCSPKSKMFREA
jgi:hypothetical protein